MLKLYEIWFRGTINRVYATSYYEAAKIVREGYEN